jgi:transcriptional regulator with XRE-family HTH domain
MTDRGKRAQTFALTFSRSDTDMLKVSLPYMSLGVHVQRARQDRKITQRALAQYAQVAITTLRLLEQGRGNLTSFWQVLDVLHLNIVGRNLPPGQHIGERIITLRKRKGVSQRELIKLIGVSQPTLIELEHRCTGRLLTLDRVLVALGAGAYLASIGAQQSFYTHAGNSSTSENWETP